MDDYDYQSRIVNERKKTNQERQNLFSKNKLKDDFKKRMKTTMIGALASFEDVFGELFGLDKEELSPEQEKLCDMWEDVREDILDKGNKQIRYGLDEIDCYDVKWNKYKYNFKMGDKNEF